MARTVSGRVGQFVTRSPGPQAPVIGGSARRITTAPARSHSIGGSVRRTKNQSGSGKIGK